MPDEVVFLQANDRYQTVICSDQGSSTTFPEFRYWYAGPALWSETISGDTAIPAYHTLNEAANYTPGILELPYVEARTYRSLRRPIEDLEFDIGGVFVEFIPRPSSISETISDGYQIGFTCQVEGVGVASFSRTVSGALTTGITTTSAIAYSTTVQTQDATYWPNVKSVYIPARLSPRVRAARVILTDIHLVEITRVQLLGEIHPIRNV